MSMNSSLDTNLLLRLIWRDLPDQYQKVVELLDDESQTFYISDLVVAEVVFNLQMKDLPRATIVSIIQKIAEKKNVEINDFITETILPYFAEHPALSFVDCYAAFEAEKKGREPLWTFDRRLANQHPSAKRVI